VSDRRVGLNAAALKRRLTSIEEEGRDALLAVLGAAAVPRHHQTIAFIVRA
jgi:hypothetical protein